MNLGFETPALNCGPQKSRTGKSLGRTKARKGAGKAARRGVWQSASAKKRWGREGVGPKCAGHGRWEAAGPPTAGNLSPAPGSLSYLHGSPSPWTGVRRLFPMRIR